MSRALEKLRKFFSKRGVVSTAAIIAGAIAANSVQAAPPAVIKSATALALAKGATAWRTPILALVKGALKLMAWTKLKYAVGAGGVALLAGGIVVAVAAAAANTDTPKQSGHDSDDRYQVEGEVTYTVQDRETVRDFTLTVNGSNWMIHLAHTKPDPGANEDWSAHGLAGGTPLKLDYKQMYEENVGLNGSVYTYDYFGQLPPDDPAKNNGTATIEYGDTATESFSFANYVWAGLASGYYLSGATNHVVTPISMTTVNPRNDRDKSRLATQRDRSVFAKIH